MAEIIRSPLSGGIRAARNTVPSSLFRTNETDPVFGRWLQNNNGIGNALAARNSTLLEGIQAQLNGVSNQAVVLSNALQVIASNIAADSALEQQRVAAETKRQRSLVQQGLRDDKEEAIESRIQAALMAPVRRVRAKIEFGLGKLMNFFMILTGGWLTLKVVRLLEADADGNIKLVQQIKGEILKGLLIIAGTLLALKFGLFGLKFLLGRLIFRLGVLAFRGFLRAPLVYLKNFIVNLVSKIKNWAWERIKMSPIYVPQPQPVAKNFNEGGLVDGPEGVDKVPANLTKGEFVLSNAAVEDLTKNFGKNVLNQLNDPEFLDQAVQRDNKEQKLRQQYQSVLDGYLERAGDNVTRRDIANKRFNSFIMRKMNEDRTRTRVEKGNDGNERVIQTFDMGFGEIDLSKPMGSEKNKGGQKVVDPETLEFIKQEQYIGKYGKLPPSMGGDKDVSPKPVVEPKIETKKQNTSDTYKKITELPEVKPTVISIPTSAKQQQQSQPTSNATSSGSATGGNYPKIPSRNLSNNYVVLAYKHYQVTP